MLGDALKKKSVARPTSATKRPASALKRPVSAIKRPVSANKRPVSAANPARPASSAKPKVAQPVAVDLNP